MEFSRNQTDPLQVTVCFTAEALSFAHHHLPEDVSVELFGCDWNSLAANTLLPEMVFSDEFPSAIRWRSGLAAGATNDELLQEAFAHLAYHVAHGNVAAHESVPGWNAPASIRALALKTAISILPIEDMFPNHAWNNHLNESLAACYHTLAAYFIKLSDLEAAQDCLRQSDTLEESPRALALRALISQAHGETLGAVANMVSSLQHYEQRKNPDVPHYVSFQPRDIEVVNEKLKDGLEALNSRDNETALNKFTEAVSNFDDFYRDLKLV